MFHAQKSSTSTTDAVGSAVAMILLLATWCCLYVAILPADPTPRAHVAWVQK